MRLVSQISQRLYIDPLPVMEYSSGHANETYHAVNQCGSTIIAAVGPLTPLQRRRVVLLRATESAMRKWATETYFPENGDNGHAYYAALMGNTANTFLAALVASRAARRAVTAAAELQVLEHNAVATNEKWLSAMQRGTTKRLCVVDVIKDWTFGRTPPVERRDEFMGYSEVLNQGARELHESMDAGPVAHATMTQRASFRLANRKKSKRLLSDTFTMSQKFLSHADFDKASSEAQKKLNKYNQATDNADVAGIAALEQLKAQEVVLRKEATGDIAMARVAIERTLALETEVLLDRLRLVVPHYNRTTTWGRVHGEVTAWVATP